MQTRSLKVPTESAICLPFISTLLKLSFFAVSEKVISLSFPIIFSTITILISGFF